MNQREDVAMVLSEEFFKMFAAGCPDMPATDCACACKGFVYLGIELPTVCHDDKGMIPFEFSVDFLAEKDH